MIRPTLVTCMLLPETTGLSLSNATFVEVIVRNLYTLNLFIPLPVRSCEKKTLPPSSSLIAIAVTAITGAVKTASTAAITYEKAYFTYKYIFIPRLYHLKCAK